MEHEQRVVVLTRAELQALVREAIGEALKPPSNDALLTLRQTGVSTRTLRAAIAAGDLPAMKVGREFRVRRADLDAWLAARAVAPRPAPAPAADDPVTRALRRGALRAARRAA
jgi:excisionase family DNA binding protein